MICSHQGWNVFQRQFTAGQQLSPGEWKRANKECSRKWQAMTVAEREPYTATALEEQSLREQLLHEPFSSRDQHDGCELEKLVPKNAQKTLSLHRLLATYRGYKGSSWWENFDAGLCSADGAMSLDLIDLETPQEDMQARWDRFVNSATVQVDALEFPYDKEAAASLPLNVCGSGPGLCSQIPCHEHACKFAACLHQMIKDSPLV